MVKKMAPALEELLVYREVEKDTPTDNKRKEYIRQRRGSLVLSGVEICQEDFVLEDNTN